VEVDLYAFGRNKNKIALFKLAWVIPVLVESLQYCWLLCCFCGCLPVCYMEGRLALFRTPTGKWETRCRLINYNFSYFYIICHQGQEKNYYIYYDNLHQGWTNVFYRVPHWKVYCYLGPQILHLSASATNFRFKIWINAITIHGLAQALFQGETLKLWLFFTRCWRCNTNGPSQNALLFLCH